MIPENLVVCSWIWLRNVVVIIAKFMEWNLWLTRKSRRKEEIEEPNTWEAKFL